MLNIAEALAQGTRLHQSGQLAEAETIYRQVLTEQPGCAEALHLMGMMALQNRQFEAALQWINQAIAIDRSQYAFYANLGEAYRHLKKPPEAIASYRQAIALENNLPTVHIALSGLLRDQGNLAEAEVELREGLRQKPDDPEALLKLACVLYDRGKLVEAEECCRRLLSISPEAVVYFNLGAALESQKKINEAIESYRSALERNPNDSLRAMIYTNLGGCLHLLGMAAETVDCARKIVAADPDNSLFGENLPHSLHYPSGYGTAEIFAEHLNWARRHAEPLARYRHSNDPSPGRRIKIGYVSPYFRAHAISVFTEPILAAHDHAQFEVACYSDLTKPAELTAEFRRFSDRWIDTGGMSDADLAARIYQDRVDVLVDLTGHLTGSRLLAFARKPAPVQVTYIGYQNTTGMTAMDYRLTDAFADPPGQTDRFYTERLVRLPHAFFVYQPARDAPQVNALPAIANGHVTFGSFNKLAKITPQALSTWARILARVPKSRMIVLAEVADQVAHRLHHAFALEGISADRIDVVPARPRVDYLRLTQQVDIALDSFPFNGHTTVCESLWMGVPTVVLAGDRYVSRFGGSALTTLGLDEFIANSLEAYVEIAVRCAADLNSLQQLRAELRPRMLASPLLDYPGFTRDLEAAFRTMWDAWCARQAVPERA